jgi:hypothetical protein
MADAWIVRVTTAASTVLADLRSFDTSLQEAVTVFAFAPGCSLADTSWPTLLIELIEPKPTILLLF